ncbi:MAG TPA: hypothetical protein VH414_04400 [Lichenihabitans sp.]|jgi:hypothetical protein|nr:hypothetical protein [Lichenihabitans sp.]
MKTDTKLAPFRGALQKLHLHAVVTTARRAIESTMERYGQRPLRDVDGWSDQAEVAFYEERCNLKA